MRQYYPMETSGNPKVTFRAELLLAGKSATGFVVPAEAVESLGNGKRPPVAVTINGYTYRNTVAVMGGEFMVGVAAEHRAAAQISAGQIIDVTLELDTAPREVEVPEDFADALAADPVAKAAFDKMSYSHKRQHVLAIADAKTAETRARRIAKAIEMLNSPKG